MTRTLVLSNVFPPRVGGSGRWLWELYRRFTDSDVLVVAGPCQGDQAFDDKSSLKTVRARLAPGDLGGLWPGGRSRYAALRKEVLRLASDFQPEAVHACCVIPEGWIALGLQKRLGIPYACYVHGEEIAVYRQSRELSWMARRVLRSASRVIVNSHNTLTQLREAWPESASRAVVIHPGVDTSVYVPADRDDEQRSELGWSGKKVVLTVGRLQRRKGHDKMIEAIAEITRAIPDFLYAVVGAGEERPRLERIAQEHGVADRVQFCGEVTDARLVQYFQQCDLFALPNRTVNGDFEGFGMVLVEAQSCGKPALSGDSGGAPETLIDGETGVVVDCREAGNIAAAVTEMLNDPERLSAVGAAARRRAVEVFDWARLANDAESFLKLDEPSTVGAR